MIDSDELLNQLQIATNNTAVSWPSEQNRDFEIIRMNKTRYGIGLPVSEEVEINEKFANCRIQTISIEKPNSGGVKEKIAVLSCSSPGLLRHFVSLALDFLNPDNRIQIYKDPLSWWKDWTRLTGNAMRLKKPASLIAELLVLNELTEKGVNPKWGGSSQAIHDIETDEGDVDVKSTLSHSEHLVTIHGEFQLADEKNMDLAFCRLEQSKSGHSISSLVQNLVSNGWDESYLSEELEKLGYEPGSSVVDEKYKLIEKKYYPVDNEFPRIVPASFINGEIPSGVSKINYTVNLDKLKSRDEYL